MIVKTTDDIRGTKGEVNATSWSSYRLLHKEDGMGVTLTDAILEPGLDQAWWYRKAAAPEGGKQAATMVCYSRARNDRVPPSGDHGSKYRVEAYLICGTARFPVSQSSSIRRPRRSGLGYAGSVIPTVLRVRGFRFYFFSREERQVTEVQELIEEHIDEIRGAWAKHFPSGSH